MFAGVKRSLEALSCLWFRTGTFLIVGKNDLNSIWMLSCFSKSCDLTTEVFTFPTRQKISKEGIPEVKSTIRELEAEWDRKWRDTLKNTPLVSFLNEDPVSHSLGI